MATGMHINFQMKMKEIEHISLFTDNPSSFFTTFIHSLHVTTSIYPVPSICAQDQISSRGADQVSHHLLLLRPGDAIWYRPELISAASGGKITPIK